METELLLSLPPWVVENLDIILCSSMLVLFGGLMWCVMRSGAKADLVDPEAEITLEGFAPKTRREGLDLVLAGKWEWDDYLAFFRNKPDDGSLKAEQKRVEAALAKAAKPMLNIAMDNDKDKTWLVLKKDGNLEVVDHTVPCCSKTAHQGFRVHKSRVDVANLRIWQPRSGTWFKLKYPMWVDSHPCCSEYRWIHT